jgi:hypothetical protein
LNGRPAFLYDASRVARGTLDRQLDLFAPRLWPKELQRDSASRLCDALASLLAEGVRLVVHDNRSTMVSYRRGAVVEYRVHHMFLDAPPDVVRALADFAASRGVAGRRRAAGDRIDAYVRSHRARIAAPRPARLVAQGSTHDLQAIFDRLNATWFGGRIEARIGWGAVQGRRRRRTIKTGVYVQDARLIRIHRALDRPEVPEMYVAMVVFHEMLHQAVPAVERDGRRVVHGPEFRRLERAYPDYARARAWEEGHLHLLLAPRD